MALRTKIYNIERYLATNATVTALDDWGTVVRIGATKDLPRCYAKNWVTGEISLDAELIQAIETKYRTDAKNGVYTNINVVIDKTPEDEQEEKTLRALVESGRVQMMNPGGTYGEP